ncbi:MAG TPA: sigma-70 family RNA polymerase sigma factor [Spirochaetales bacterium]|nr:sigma-70 family RNA polymerase sigma factor [Spirochaetales bacterium]HRY56380.1 sigma-70 family RNA polymerase sigma factor [Spirochaetia bacterium]HRZ64508.1 sigma-70 family RNA polymerase sigma factor [Spirochaetia bacterium]
MNPFTEDRLEEEAEAALVRGAQHGDAAAMERLIKLHQRWIFNVVLRMVPDFDEAEDLCQEIILKAFLRIGSFQGRSRFRTWLYRIAVNQVLDARESDCERTLRASGGRFADDSFMECYLGQEIADPQAIPCDLRLLAQEIRIKCMLGMLVCLDRKQRMVFILGGILGVGSRTAGEILGMSDEGFRKALSRSRRRLRNFLFDRCSLVNPAKPCTCARSIRANVQGGYVDPLHLVFGAGSSSAIRDIVCDARRRLDTIEFDRCQELYLDHPFEESPDFSREVLRILESEDFRSLLDAAPRHRPPDAVHAPDTDRTATGID